MYFSQVIRDIIAVFLAGCLTIVVHGQGEGPSIAAVIDSAAKPQPFAPGIVCSRFTEWATSFTPDDKTVYFSRGALYWTVCFAQNKGGVWQRPEVASFSGVWNDTDPFVTPDGKKLFFVSNRPLEGAVADKPNPSFHLWYVAQAPGGGWGKPHHVEGGVNIDSSSNYGPCVSARGTLYWCARDRQGNKGMQGYYSVWLGDHYDQPKLLQIAGVDAIQDPFIAPNEKYLVFLSGSDLYISFRQKDGWGAAQTLGPQVNNGDGNSSPFVSHDGKTLYYSSGRIVGFYHRERKKALNYDELEKENDSWVNGQDNILMIPIRLPAGI